MLRELHISGLGVIEDLDLELHPGLNVLTGETGTGKTMVTVGLQLALGRRGGTSLVRAGAPAAKVQARFDAPAAAVSAGWAEDGEVFAQCAYTARSGVACVLTAYDGWLHLVPRVLAEIAPRLPPVALSVALNGLSAIVAAGCAAVCFVLFLNPL
jgi:hypothetical protein